MTEQDEWDRPPSVVASPESWIKRLKRTLTVHWQPEPLALPVVDPDLPHLSGIERAAEVVRFMLHKAEYWLSPGGSLREFVKLNVRVAGALAIPAVAVAPLVTFALEQFKAWTVLLTQTTSGFVLFPMSVGLCILLICGLFYIGRSIMEVRMRMSRRDGYY